MFRFSLSPMLPVAARSLARPPSSLAVITSSAPSSSLMSAPRSFQTNQTGMRPLLTRTPQTITAPMSQPLRSWYRTSEALRSENKTEEPIPSKGVLGEPKTDGAEKETQSLISKNESIPTGAAVATAMAVAPILLGAAGILYYPPINFHLAQHITSLQLTYGTMFISFFGASHFGFAASNYQAPPPSMTIPDAPAPQSPSSSSSLRALQYALGTAAPMITWGCLFLSPLFSYTSLLGATTALFLGDLFFWKKGMVPLWWVKMRYRATIAVLIGLGASFMVVQK